YFKLSSPEYAADYNEVKSIGGASSKTRPPPQSEKARFWYEPSPAGLFPRGTELVVTTEINLGVSAGPLPLLNLVAVDGLITGYDAKYRYNCWRPVTAIRNGANDGNPQTAGDPAWNSYLETPSHPEYLSLHAVLNAAWAEVLARFFGTDQLSFTIKSA